MPMISSHSLRHPHVVIVGGGFAGLAAARALGRSRVRVTLVDRHNHHLFQPLLYQVASATLSPADIAAPIRHILRGQSNVAVLLGEISDIDLEQKRIALNSGARISYDFLILATGVGHSYFGNESWSTIAPGLKTLEDALEIRRRFLVAFELAEQETDPQIRKAFLTFVIVGGGPTGVELAGTMKEMARLTLPKDFRNIRTEQARVVLVEAGSGVLASFGEGLSEKALKSLEGIGVEVHLGQPVSHMDEQGVQLGSEYIPARTVLWAAGIIASPLGRALKVPLDPMGRVVVESDLSIPSHPEVLVIGDLAHFEHGSARPLPGLAPVAVQQGRLAAENIVATIEGRSRKRFVYRDRGTMATIGRGSAIARLGPFHFAGFLAWLAWLFVHLMLLVNFRNRVFVFFEWLWAYVTKQRRARLILPRC